MNINFKDILQKLSVFKNNLWLSLTVAIGLIGVLFFIPTELMSNKLKQEIQTKSVSIGKKVKIETENAVSSEGWRQEQERQQEHAKDANEISRLAEQSTQRELLSYDIFLDPNISSTLVFQQFGRRYREAIDQLIIRSNAGDCPTEAEIKRGLEDSAVNSRLRRGRYSLYGRSGMYGSSPISGRSGGSGRSDMLGRSGMMGPYSMMGRSGMTGRSGMMGPYSMGGTRASSRGILSRSMMMGELELMIVDEICRERAKSISVYVNPIDLSGYEFWADYKLAVDPNKAVQDCWYFQLAYWIFEDIFDTISAVNSGYDSVLTAPVKQLMRTSFTMGLRRPGAGGAVFTGRRRRKSGTDRDDVDKPVYVLTKDDALTESCTGRVSNDANNIDVIHFNMTVVLNMKSVLPFIQELCSAKEHKFSGFTGNESEQTFKHNQITVLETKFRSIEDDPYSLYDYGEDVVVELDLICEYIFNRKGYEEIKPEIVKKALKVEEQTTGR